jgi:uncharacterized membrane protein HdeD (DUF308 family)
MTMSLEAAARAMREAMRQTVKRHSLWYLVQSGLMILAGILALIYPVVSSFAAVFLLGCVLILGGIVQGISLIDARDVPHFWLQLVSVVLSVIVGVLLIRHRAAGLLVLTLLLLVYFMVEGISKVIFALTIRPFPNWGWLLASGIFANSRPSRHHDEAERPASERLKTLICHGYLSQNLHCGVTRGVTRSCLHRLAAA